MELCLFRWRIRLSHIMCLHMTTQEKINIHIPTEILNHSSSFQETCRTVGILEFGLIMFFRER
jgi:hypothetical protein